MHYWCCAVQQMAESLAQQMSLARQMVESLAQQMVDVRVDSAATADSQCIGRTGSALAMH